MLFAEISDWLNIAVITISIFTGILLFQNIMKSSGNKPPEKLHLKE